MLQLQLALHEIVGILVFFGGLGHALMIGPTIFKFGLALLNACFLDLEFGESRLGQHNGCRRDERGPKDTCLQEQSPVCVQL